MKEIPRCLPLLPCPEVQYGRERNHVEKRKCRQSRSDRYAGEALGGIKQHLKLKRGDWRQWVTDHLPFSYPSAQRYMQIAKHWEEITAKKSRLISGDPDKPGPSLSAAMRLIRKPRGKTKRPSLQAPAWHKDY